MDINPSPTLLQASKGVRYAAVLALSLLSLFLFAETLSTLSSMSRIDTSNVATITVNGTGKATATPDIAHISFTVQEEAATVAAAQDAATKRTNDALAAVKKLGIADADVKTDGYNVNPQYETAPCVPGFACPQSSKISGYQVSQSVEVKVRDTSKAGDVLQQLGTLGVQNISGPDFAVDDPSATQADARGKAIADARAKAEVLAKQLGVHLGRVVGYSENGSAAPYPMMFAAGAKSVTSTDAVAPTLPTGTSDTTSDVTVIYEIRS